MDELLEHWGEGWVAGAVAPSQQGDPGFMEWAGRLERLAASPAHDPPHLRPDRRVRRARRAAVDPRADARDAPDRRQLPQGRALALHRVEDPRRALRGARGRRQHVLARRLRGADRRDRGVPHRHAPRARAGPHARHGAVHGHRGLHPARRRDGRPRLALPARAPRRALPPGARAPPRQGGQAHRRRLPGDLRRARRARSAAPPRWPRRWARSGSRCAPASTRASSR